MPQYIVCLSVRPYCDHIGWNSSKIISLFQSAKTSLHTSMCAVLPEWPAETAYDVNKGPELSSTYTCPTRRLGPRLHYQSLEPGGGLGVTVRPASDVALPAFLSSIIGSVPLVHQILPERLHDSIGTDDALFIAAVSEWKARCAMPSPDPPLYCTALHRRHAPWDTPLVNASRGVYPYLPMPPMRHGQFGGGEEFIFTKGFAKLW